MQKRSGVSHDIGRLLQIQQSAKGVAGPCTTAAYFTVWSSASGGVFSAGEDDASRGGIEALPNEPVGPERQDGTSRDIGN